MHAIRTLVVEYHMGAPCSGDSEGLDGSREAKVRVVERRIELMERLKSGSTSSGSPFVVTGSTLDIYNAGFRPDAERLGEEPFIHVPTGMDVGLTTVTYTNRALLG